MRPLLVMTACDLRQRLRDRSLLIFGVVVPLALMTVLNFVVGGAWEPEIEDVTVAVSAPQDDPMVATVLAVIGSSRAVDVTVDPVSAQEAAARPGAGDANLGLVFSEGFAAGIMAGAPVTVELIEGEGAGLGSTIVVSVVEEILARFGAGAQAVAAGAATGLTHDQFEAVATEVGDAPPVLTVVDGTASSEQLDAGGALVAGQAGLFLFFTIGFGVIALLQEREQGTLERLRSMPMRPWLIVAAKALGSFLLGVVATTVLLTAGGAMFDTDFGDPVAVAVLIVAACAAVTALMFVVARLARTTEQANLIQVMLAMILGIAGGAFFPMSAEGALGTLMELNPVAALVRGLGITAGGGGPGDIGVPVLTLLAFGAVVAVIARLVPNRGGLA